MASSRICSKAALVCVAILMTSGIAFAQPKTGARIGGVAGVGYDDCSVNAQIGSTIIRAGQSWNELQPTNTTIDFNYQDGVFDCFVSHGMHIYYTLAYAPDWAGGHASCNGDNNFQCHVPDTNAWRQFVYTVIFHYSYEHPLGNNITFGIWNEPEGRFLTGCPSGYSKSRCWGQLLWLPAAEARDMANPSARLAGPEMGVIDGRLDEAFSYMAQRISPQDVISTHWYPGSSQYIIPWTNTVNQKAGGRETWLTETGVNNCNDTNQASQLDSILYFFSNLYDYEDRLPNPHPMVSATAFIIYQVIAGDADSCFDIHNRPSQNVMSYWINYVAGSPPPPPPPPPQDYTPVPGGTVIYPEQSIASPNGRFVLKYQNDGNFVLYDNGAAAWAINCWPDCNSTGFAGNPFQPAGYATMQTDGNLVVYNAMGGPNWHTWTFNNPGAYLAIYNDGRLIVYRSDGVVLWQR